MTDRDGPPDCADRPHAPTMRRWHTRTRPILAVAALLALPPMAADGATPPDLVGRDVLGLLGDLAAGRVTAVALVRGYEARIRELDRAGADGGVNAVLALEPGALAEAAASDARRAKGDAPRPLEGIPILIKDNVETAGTLPTTAGSLALRDNVTNRDAPLVARLRAAGAVILGKTNLSEWANFRSTHSISGWSGVGGLTRNPFATDRTACGSSSGSAAAVAASFAPAAIGTETDGSITCPAAMTGLVGFKPTVGLVSRRRVVPISATQDTAGPMTRTVADAALLLSVLAGTDPADPATADADRHRTPATVAADALRGARIGIARFLVSKRPSLDAPFARALDTLRREGATLVELPDGPDLDAIGRAEFDLLLAEFKTGLDAYLADAAPAVATRNLASVLAFDASHADRELGLFDQDIAERAETSGGAAGDAYERARDTARRFAGAEGLEPLFASHRLDAIVAPSTVPAPVIDTVNGDADMPAASTLPAVLGWPHLTVPMGTVAGLPVGLSFIGPAWSDARILALGAGYARHAPEVPTPALRPVTEAIADRASLLAPAVPVAPDAR